MNATDHTFNSPEPVGSFDPNDRFSIYTFALLNRDKIVQQVASSRPHLPVYVIEEAFDAATDKVFLPCSDENAMGFDASRYDDGLDAGLYNWLRQSTTLQLRTQGRRHSQHVAASDEALSNLVTTSDDVVTQVEQRAMLEDLATNAPIVMEYAVARANGTTSSEFTANGLSRRQRDYHHKRLRAIREDWRSLAPVALFLRLIQGPRGGETVTAAGGAGAGTAATVGGSAIVAKVGAVCAAGVLCVGGVVEGVKHYDSKKPTKTVAATKAPQTSQRLYTPIPQSISSTRQTQKKKAAQAARKQADARKRAASRRQAAAVDNEFGVEAGSSTSGSSSPSSSSESETTSSSDSPEFGVEAGQ